MQQGAKDPFFVSTDFGLPASATIVVQVKRCKSGKHCYIGHNRCIACKREYDRRYHKNRRLQAKARRVNKMHLMQYANLMPLPTSLVTKSALV